MRMNSAKLHKVPINYGWLDGELPRLGNDTRYCNRHGFFFDAREGGHHVLARPDGEIWRVEGKRKEGQV